MSDKKYRVTITFYNRDNLNHPISKLYFCGVPDRRQYIAWHVTALEMRAGVYHLADANLAGEWLQQSYVDNYAERFCVRIEEVEGDES